MRPLDRRVLDHLRVARAPLATVVASGVAGAGLVVAQAFAVAALVTALLAGGPWRAPAVAVLLVTAGRVVVSVAADRAGSRAAARVGRRLRGLVLDRATALGGSAALTGQGTGELTTLATRGVAATEPYLTRYLPALVLAVVLPPVVLVAIATQDVAAALVVVATLPLVPVFAALVGLATRDRAERQWRLLGSLAGHFVDLVRGLPTLVAHRRAAAQTQRVHEVTDRYRRANRDVLRLAFASSAVLELVATLSVALVAVLVGLRLAAGGLDLQTALVVLLLAPEAYWPLRRVGAEFHAAAEGTATFEAIAALDQDASPTGAARTGTAVRLVGASVTWPGHARPAVGPIDLELPRRGLVVLRGPSGCGKSTLLAALMAEVPLSAGLLEVPAEDRTAWRRRVAHLSQRPWLLAGTVADNVRVGRAGASDAEVGAALETVGLDLDPGSRLDEDGAGLSAGQRARLGLARIVVSDRDHVLLDEPTAHLDRGTAERVAAVVAGLAATRCVVAVAHDEALTHLADRVVDLPAPTPVAPATAQPASHPPLTPRRAVAAPTTTDRSWPDGRSGADGRSVPDDARRGPLALATLLATLASSSGVALSATAGWLIARSAEQPPVLTLLVAVVGVRLFGLTRPVLRYAERLVSHDVALRRLASRRTEVYAALVPLVPGAVGRRRGDLLASVVDDVDAVADETLRVRMPVWTWLGATGLVAIVATVLHPITGLVLLGLGAGAGGGAWLVAHLGARRTGEARVRARARLAAGVLELLTEARPRLLWGADAPLRARIEQDAGDLERATLRAEDARSLARAWPLLLGGVGVVAAAAAIAVPLDTGVVSGPVAALLVLVPLALVEVTTPLADAGSLGEQTRAARSRLDELTARRPAVVEPILTGTAGAERSGGRQATGVRLDAVSAGWDEQVAVRDVSLRLAPGGAVALRGPSGSGKSTLAAVLVRFVDPVAGRYRLDGHDVRHLRLDDVRARVGLLDDAPYVFATTLAENVRLARPDADDVEVEAALRSARLGPWLDALPGGLATRLGDGAADVSGGERARLGLARLLLGGQRVLVLDEPTAHLDPDTARGVIDELTALRRPWGELGSNEQGDQRALVWITHVDLPASAVDTTVTLPAPGWTRAG